MCDEVDEVRALQIGARDLAAFHEGQEERAVFLRLERYRRLLAINDLVDVFGIIADLIAHDHLDRRTASTDERRQEMRRQVLEDETVAAWKLRQIAIVAQTLEAHMEGCALGLGCDGELVILDLVVIGEPEVKLTPPQSLGCVEYGRDSDPLKAVEP